MHGRSVSAPSGIDNKVYSMPDNTINVNDGTNQILPNAQEGKQYFIGDSAIKLALQHSEAPVDNSTADKDNTGEFGSGYQSFDKRAVPLQRTRFR